MFRFYAKKLTESSNHYLDWSRIGELVQAGNHRYSKDEVITRGGIIAFTAVAAFLGYLLNDSEKTNCSDVQMSVALGVSGFILSHAVVIYPLVQKRLELSKDCALLSNEIIQKLEKNVVNMSSECKAKVQEELLRIKNLSLSNEDHGKASQTWGRRRRLLSEINEKLLPEKFNEADWVGSAALQVSFNHRGM
jgi:hypothetical protein